MTDATEAPALFDPADPWLSVYLFINGWIYAADCDRIALDVAEPFVRRCMAEGWADAHFFIRYSEHGPHLRLRLHGDPRVLQETVWPALVEHVRAHSPDVVVDGLPAAPHRTRAEDEPLRILRISRVAYERETERYGGEHALPVAERVFQVSSDAAYELIARLGAERSSRLGKGLLSLVVLVHVFLGDRERGAAFGQMYSTSYLRSLAHEGGGRETYLNAFDQGFQQQSGTLAEYVDEVWLRLDEDEPVSDTLDAYAAGLRACRDELRALSDAGLLRVGGSPAESWERAVAGIVPSYAHMMNNRLGITIQEESYLAFLLNRALLRPLAAVEGETA
ncbi:MAG TPA: thiopeptide-type bacteriocin biosynthesis protein [Longimicrobium sp.]|jgi:thiopeptide-type bacteriocin biosynthesis protein|uniref:thiopeptide-type bacteriocin biosynthesis protein n=1 Tax=Longimicrobium sp. TaxID=2029185 RepID=UPI002EDB97AE